MHKLVIRADDLGISPGVNCGIRVAVQDGFVKAVGLMVNLPDAAHGYALVQPFSHIELGLHCNIVLGQPVAPAEAVSSLLDTDGSFRRSSYYRTTDTDTLLYEQVRTEVAAQIDAFRHLTGREPAYIDYHAACTPTFVRALEDTCQEQKLLYVPYPHGSINGRELHYCQLSNGDSFDISPDAFYERNRDVILGHEATVAIFHPGYVDARIMQVSSLNVQRAIDLVFTTHPDCRKWLQSHDVEPVGFAEFCAGTV